MRFFRIGERYGSGREWPVTERLRYEILEMDMRGEEKKENGEY